MISFHDPRVGATAPRRKPTAPQGVVPSLALLLGAFLLAGCPDGGLEEAGEEVDEVVEEGADAVEDAAEDLSDAVDQ